MENPIVERDKRLEKFFQKVEEVLTENFEVIGKLLVPKVKETEDSFQNTKESVS